MDGIQKQVAHAAVIAFLCAPALLSAAVISELHITSDGNFQAKGLTVVQKSGTNLFTRATWGSAFIRVTTLTNASTTVVKKYGENSTVREIEAGHVLDVEGKLTSGADSMMITAHTIRNLTLERESKTISGVITSIDRGRLSFVLLNSTYGATTVVLSASTPILKGARSITFADLVVGDGVISTSGSYDYPQNTLTATSLEIYQNKTIFEPRNFQGALKSITGTSLPAQLAVTAEGKEYTIYLSSESVVMSKDRKPASLKRFAPGDTVRFYGTIHATNFNEVDAEVIRDLDF